MSVVAELRIAAGQFELGRILPIPEGTELELERVVPVGERAVPLVWTYDADPERFARSVRNHPAVDSFDELDRFDGETLYALRWDASSDHLFDAIHREDAHLLRATAVADTWTFELRFHTHESLSAFQRHCENAHVHYGVRRITTPDGPVDRRHYGLTEQQREALVLAVETGYYDIPRRRSTVDLAEQLGISDQAVTERLRRAIVALSTSTVVVPDAPDRSD
ncbi:helix-turn-helix domain-containing protein [Halomarina rubra]|uniref:Helix-turn-helix domain-containing protein n=1 Tax=Halomarina rubra TaxID=2071873 RepID=A0ABD6AU87_9EURY|nr:helix-turn-helix domain-containing protein [Halomarina rubra]